MQSTVLLLLSVLFLCLCLYLCLSYVGGAFLHPRTRPQFVTCKDSGVIYVDTMGSVKKRWAWVTTRAAFLPCVLHDCPT